MDTEHLVNVAARRYARRSWWVDIEELKQEGRVAVLEAARTWEHDFGVPRKHYYWRAVVFAMKRYMWTASTPVSGGSHRPRQSYEGLHRAPLGVYECRSRGAEDLLAEAEWLQHVRARLHELQQETGTDGVHRVLLEEVTAKELADSTGRDRKDVYAWAARLRTAITQDRALYELMRVRKA